MYVWMDFETSLIMANGQCSVHESFGHNLEVAAQKKHGL